jgi:hypothetical protein
LKNAIENFDFSFGLNHRAFEQGQELTVSLDCTGQELHVLVNALQIALSYGQLKQRCGVSVGDANV